MLKFKNTRDVQKQQSFLDETMWLAGRGEKVACDERVGLSLLEREVVPREQSLWQSAMGGGICDEDPLCGG